MIWAEDRFGTVKASVVAALLAGVGTHGTQSLVSS